MKMMHRKKGSEESNHSTRPQPLTMAMAAPKRNPKHLDLMEAASLKEREARQAQQLARQHTTGHLDIGAGKENMLGEKPLSRPALSKMQNSYRQIAYNQYLSEAFGLDGRVKPIQPIQPVAVQRLQVPHPEQRPGSDMSTMTADSMEVNFHSTANEQPSVRDRRPKIHVTIPSSTAIAKPKKRPTSTAHLAHQLSRSKTNARSQRQRAQQETTQSSFQQTQEAPARMSVVSTHSKVQMPKPRRPFSAFSLEEMTNDMPIEAPLRSAPLPSMEKSATTDSSEDSAGDLDDRSSIYSARSSASSLPSESAINNLRDQRKHSIAFSIISPAAAGVFDGMPLSSDYAAKFGGLRSTTSLATVDMNKPLPPEPEMADVLPLKVPGYSTPGSMRGRRNAPSPLTISRNSMIEGGSQLPSRMSSLRSKYTPADLDALDEAFKTSPNAPAGFYMPRSPTLSVAQMELEAHLGTINEEPGSQRNTIAVNDPLQISRGPNAMIPSRHAPPPPSSSSSIKLSDGSISGRKRTVKKSKPSHVVSQLQTKHARMSSDSGSESDIKRRTTMPVRSRSTMKAERVLGKPASPTSSAMTRERSAESNWSSSPSSRSPHTSSDETSSSPTMSREDSSTPETDVSSIFPDHAFEEVKARLELLSPKNDQHYLTNWSATSASYSDFNASPCQSQAQEQKSSDAERDVGPKNETFERTIPTEEKQESLREREDAQNADNNLSLLQRRGRLQSVEGKPRSLTSIAMSEIPDMYASLPTPSTIRGEYRDSMTEEEAERMISADAAEKVLLRILENLDNLQDLFATATVSRGFYRTFKRHELPLMKNALHGMSPAAWELREMSSPYPGLEGTSPKLDYSPALYLQHYMRDMYIMIALKSVILIHCESFLRADTITALAGGETERATQIDDAFWRIWTFCQVFGCGSGREEDIVGQMDWLRGGQLAKQQRKNRNTLDLGSDVDRNSVLYSSPESFGKGNAGGLSAEDLYDMTEIWTCLGVLVRGFHGKRQEAREFGIFQNADITAGDIEKEDAVLGMISSYLFTLHSLTFTLEEWTHHLLTLAPPTVLDVTSPTSPTAQTFAHARTRGYTAWTPPTVSRATFLKEAVSRIYQEKTAERHLNSPTSPRINIDPSSPTGSSSQADDVIAARWRCARHAAEIRAKRNDPNFHALPASEDRPMSEFPSVLAALDPASTPPMPGHSRTASEEDTSKNFVSALVVPAGPQVRDPVDIAVEKFVAMGFQPEKCRKALAETDTGNSIDFAAAMEWLVRERKRDVSGLMHATYRGPMARALANVESVVSPVGAGSETQIREAVGLGLHY